MNCNEYIESDENTQKEEITNGEGEHVEVNLLLAKELDPKSDRRRTLTVSHGLVDINREDRVGEEESGEEKRDNDGNVRVESIGHHVRTTPERSLVSTAAAAGICQAQAAYGREYVGNGHARLEYARQVAVQVDVREAGEKRVDAPCRVMRDGEEDLDEEVHGHEAAFET